MENRLENIKAKYPKLHSKSDIGWLIAEVERLRETVEVLSDPGAMNAIAEVKSE